MFSEHMVAKVNWKLQEERLQYAIMEVKHAYGILVFPAPEPLIPDTGLTIPETLIPNPSKPIVPDLSAYEEANTFIVQPPNPREPQD